MLFNNFWYIAAGHTNWIDVCPSDGNLLAAGGESKDIKIYDRRQSSLAKILKPLHTSKDYRFFITSGNFES